MRKLCFAIVLSFLVSSCASINESYAPLIERVLPSVVSLVRYDDKAFCTGFVVDEKYVLTAAHCMTDTVTEYKLLMWDGSHKTATLVEARFTEADEGKDVAVLFVKEGGLVPAKMGNSKTIKQGDRVLLIGASLGLINTASTGIVSYVYRKTDFGHYIQTDSASNPGNSGGPLFNMNGEVIGMLTRGSATIALAVPIHLVMVQVNGILKRS